MLADVPTPSFLSGLLGVPGLDFNLLGFAGMGSSLAFLGPRFGTMSADKERKMEVSPMW